MELDVPRLVVEEEEEEEEVDDDDDDDDIYFRPSDVSKGMWAC
jgi:hypothetical protein